MWTLYSVHVTIRATGATMRFSLITLALAFGCNSGEFTIDDDGLGNENSEPLTLELLTPTYGEFLGDASVQVEGLVTPNDAEVTVNGESVEVSEEGVFTATLEFDKRYKLVDVKAATDDEKARVRLPVFDGHNPADTWPSAVPMRLTASGLASLGAGLGQVVDSTGWAETLSDQLPAIDQGWFSLQPIGVLHDPSTVDLIPSDEGITAAIVLNNVSLEYDGTITVGEWSTTFPVSVGFGEISVGLLTDIYVDDQGMLFAGLGSPSIALDEADIVIGVIEGDWLDGLIDGVLDLLVEPLSDLLGTALDGVLGEIPLGGPYAFETDLLGTSLDLRLSDVGTDSQGLGLGLGVGIGEAAPIGPLSVGWPGATEGADLVVGLHEGLLQTALEAGVLDLLAQDLQLSGIAGELIGAGVRNLPGGDTAPVGEGWCLQLNPNEARVVRLQSGLEPFGKLYLPDMIANIGILQQGQCTPWLDASAAVEVGLEIREGTTVGIEMEFVEGAVLEYGATSAWEEAEVVDGLNGFLQGAVSLLAGQLEFDLADIAGGLGGGEGDPLGGLLGDIEPAVVSSEPVLGNDGAPVEGMYGLGVQLWAE